MKLSAPYVSSREAPPFDDLRATTQALVQASPQRVLWASNWPHPGHHGQFDDAMLLDMLLDWTDDEAARDKILVDNPAELVSG